MRFFFVMCNFKQFFGKFHERDQIIVSALQCTTLQFHLSRFQLKKGSRHKGTKHFEIKKNKLFIVRVLRTLLNALKEYIDKLCFCFITLFKETVAGDRHLNIWILTDAFTYRDPRWAPLYFVWLSRIIEDNNSFILKNRSSLSRTSHAVGSVHIR